MKDLHLKLLLAPILVTTFLTLTTVNADDSQDDGMGIGRDGQPTRGAGMSTPEEALEKLTSNLTEKASRGFNDIFIGESAKIQEIIDIIKTGSSVYLVSDAGAGKTATVEEVARVLLKTNPEYTIHSFNSISLEANTDYRGTQEARLQLLLQALENSKGKKILFMDEFHLMTQIPKFMDTLKPMMARKELVIIAATTQDEYRQYIESDRAMVRRGTAVRLLAPTFEKVLTILRAHKSHYEAKNGFGILDASLQRIAKLTFKYFPADAPISQAFKVLERAVTLLRHERSGVSGAKLEAQDRVQAINYEIGSLRSDLKYETDESKSKIIQAQIEKIENERAQLEEKINQYERTAELQSRLQELKKEMANTQDLNRRGEIQYKDIPIVTEELAKLGVTETARADVLAEDKVSRAVGELSGYSQQFLNESVEERVARFPERMKAEVKGQNEAIDFLARKIKTNSAEVSERKAPVQVMIVGSTGVGKTFLAEKIAEFRHGSSKNMVSLSGGAMMSAESVWGLIGSERGFAGNELGGKMTEPFRSNPNQLLFFDEYGRAHRAIDNALLPIMESGSTVDNAGRVVDYSQSTWVFAHSVGAEYALDKARVINGKMSLAELASQYGFTENTLKNMTWAEIDDMIMRDVLVKNGFLPDFLNRLDAIIVANSLEYRIMLDIVKSKLEIQKDELRALKGIELKYDRSVIFAVARAGYDAQFGARPLKRALEKHVTDRLADMVIDYKAKAGDTIEMKFTRTEATGGFVQTTLKDANGHTSIMQTPLRFRTQVDIEADLRAAQEEDARLRAEAAERDAKAAAFERASGALAQPRAKPKPGQKKPAPVKKKAAVQAPPGAARASATGAASKPQPAKKAPSLNVPDAGADPAVQRQVRRARKADAAGVNAREKGEVDRAGAVKKARTK